LYVVQVKELDKLGLIVNEGKIIDASFVETPHQRNSREENKQIKEGVIPERIEANPHEKRQKDTDARWTQKNNVNYFGYTCATQSASMYLSYLTSLILSMFHPEDFQLLKNSSICHLNL